MDIETRGYHERAVGGRLAATLNAVWEAPAAGTRLILPDGSTDLLVERGTGEMYVVGAMTSAFRVPAGVGALFGVRLQPWAAFSWLGIAASELADAKVSLRDAAPRLADTLAGANSAACVLDRLARAGRVRPVDPRVREAVRTLCESSRVEVTARAIGVTERQLGRLFKQHVGLAPKLFSRALRLRRALALASDSIAEAAARSGYADQGHLCREARELAGMSAATLRSELQNAMSDSSKRPMASGTMLAP
jgi:AraC-like DNA-binding protein